MEPETIVLLESDCPLDAPTCQALNSAGYTLRHIVTEDEGAIAEACRAASAVMTFMTPVRKCVIERMERCKIVVRLGVGYDSVDFAYARTRGIPVSNIPDYCMGEVADEALAMALALLRCLPFLDGFVRGGGWKPKLPYPIRSAEATTFGIIGLGRIGRATLAHAKGFPFRFVAYDPYLAPEEFARLGAESLSLEEILKQSDILSLHTPLTPETNQLLNAERLSLMKPTAILVNTARGKIVDTVALAAALREGRLGAAGIDVFEDEPLPDDHPLLSAPNLLLAPHWAWHSSESKERLHKMGGEEALRGLRGEPLRSCVN